jgi:hypothetical protein
MRCAKPIYSQDGPVDSGCLQTTQSGRHNFAGPQRFLHFRISLSLNLSPLTGDF